MSVLAYESDGAKGLLEKDDAWFVDNLEFAKEEIRTLIEYRIRYDALRLAMSKWKSYDMVMLDAENVYKQITKQEGK